MDKIVIGLHKKVVNINGVELVLNFDNNEFLKRLSELKNVSKEETKDIGFAEYLTKYYDELFGEGTCKSIFGEDKPSYFLLYELTEALSPYIDEYSENRMKKINSKYNAEREGNV